MENGKYEFTIGGKTFTQEGNTEALIPVGTTHSIKTSEPTIQKFTVATNLKTYELKIKKSTTTVVLYVYTD